MLYSLVSFVKDPLELDITEHNLGEISSYDKNIKKIRKCSEYTLNQVISLIASSHKTLYIVGNGYDLHHKLPTKYTDFRDYIKNNDPILLNDLKFNFNLDYDNDLFWNNFEAVIKDCISIPYNRNVIPSEKSIKISFAKLISQLDNVNNKFSQIIYDWIKTVENQNIPHIDNKLIIDNLFNERSLILSYNYTNTLESCYCLPDSNIFHIHGRFNPEFNNSNEFFVGFCDFSFKILDNYRKIISHNVIGAPVQQVENDYKPTELCIISDEDREKILDYFKTRNKVSFLMNNKIYEYNVNILNKLDDVDSVVVLGHSFGESDAFSLKLLRERLPKNNIKWYLNKVW